MDTGKNDFAVALFAEIAYSLKNYFRVQRATWPTGIRHNAIGAKGITTVLDFDKSASTSSESGNGEILKTAMMR
jgi:hypothetical protein